MLHRALLRRHWQEVAVDLDDAEGMRIADGSDFAKKGQHSVWVQRQYCGELGKIANCQAGVFLAYASAHGATLIDRRLYLPEAWLTDPTFAERRAKARIPEAVTFQTKNELTLAMVRAVVESGALRCRWFLADEAFGRDTALLDAVDGLGLWYMVEMPLDSTSGCLTRRTLRRPRCCSPRWTAARGAGTRLGRVPKARASPRCTCAGCVPSARGRPARRSGCSCASTPNAARRKLVCPTRR